MPRIQLIREHTHAGKVYAVGDRLEVDATTAEWLLANDIATTEPKPARTETDLLPIPRKEPKS